MLVERVESEYTSMTGPDRVTVMLAAGFSIDKCDNELAGLNIVEG